MPSRSRRNMETFRAERFAMFTDRFGTPSVLSSDGIKRAA